MKFSVQNTKLGAALITPFAAPDDRGIFVKDYNSDKFAHKGLNFDIKEVLNVTSKKGVLRGLHYQLRDPQAKIVRCLKGHIYDVIVDLRIGSPTFKEWEAFHLTDQNLMALYVPKGFAHGYLVLEDDTMVQYFCDEVYNVWGDWGTPWNDPDLKIEWPLQSIGGINNLILSDKDRELLPLAETLQYYKDGLTTY